MSTAADAPFEIPARVVNQYLYSYGGVSRFFRALVEDRRILGTRCSACGTVSCPPRMYCARCRRTTEWVPLAGTGRVVSAVDCYYVPANYELHEYLDLPYTLALIKLDGADTAIYNTVYTGVQSLHAVQPGDKVRAVFREKREGRLTDFYFVHDDRAGDR
jgi:uncharacterized OB-fold protein